ncbi:hypothetical protein [Adhaeribacter rhizoryzae]|uniref:Uncharacterized protein n=1 Tax=Adhaeribacter rhizoryzae TaxID=2607907 RepID=A0A5M6D9W1_9BACT|nr:hypothetical protein [Adhaeribacter rhizoryzae]KAA5541975.1 hypothetical protein F0145_19505 [Adhaeribacter rhizoryzae]
MNELLQVLPEISGFLTAVTALFAAMKGILKVTGFTKSKNKTVTSPVTRNKPSKKKKRKNRKRRK